jgi:hypothetical protein
MATLTVTIKEEVVLNGQPRGSENVKSITASEYYHRIVEVPTASETTLLSFGSADAGATLSDGDAKYVRLTNLDSTNFVEARVRGADQEYFVKIAAGDTYVLFNDQMDVTDGATAAATPTFDNINDIKVKADTAACSVEVFAAS